MRRNHEKYKAMVLEKSIENEIDLLRVTVDKKLKLESGVTKICRKFVSK